MKIKNVRMEVKKSFDFNTISYSEEIEVEDNDDYKHVLEILKERVYKVIDEESNYLKLKFKKEKEQPAKDLEL